MTAMGNDQAIRLPGKAAITVVTFILLDLKFYGAWDTTYAHKAKLKEEAIDDQPWMDEKGPSSVRLMLELSQRQHSLGNFLETEQNAYMGFPRFVDTVLKRTLCVFGVCDNYHSSSWSSFSSVCCTVGVNG